MTLTLTGEEDHHFLVDWEAVFDREVQVEAEVEREDGEDEGPGLDEVHYSVIPRHIYHSIHGFEIIFKRTLIQWMWFRFSEICFACKIV